MDTKKLCRKIDEYDVVSFDIFDTLLIRPYLRPEDLFYHVDENYRQGSCHFMECRNLAFETAIRKETHEGCEEVTLAQIYQYIEPECYKDYGGIELKYEEAVLKPNPDMHKIYAYCRKQGKKILLISDMYLPKAFLEKVLRKNGITGYHAFYLSSESKKLKFTYSLYRYVLCMEDLKPEEVLHIGDNEASDYQKPGLIGIEAVRIQNKFDCLCKDRPDYIDFYYGNRGYTSSVIMGLTAYRNYIYHEKDYWKKIGYMLGGPFVLSFVQWLRDEVRLNKITDLFFIARDSYTIKQVYDLLNKEPVKTHYVYAPRSVSLVTTLNYADKFQDEWEKADTIRTILKYYREKLQIEKNYSFDNKWRNTKIFVKSLRKIRVWAKEELENYKLYLHGLDCKGNVVGMVDIMTSYFTGQKLIEEAMEENRSLIGLYHFVSNYLGENTENYRYHQQTYRWYNVPLIEFLITAPEPPIVKIEQGLPVYQDAEEEEYIRLKIYPHIAEGIVDFVRDYLHFFSALDDTPLDMEVIRRWIDYWAEHPSKKDKVQFSQIDYSIESSHTKYEPLFPKWRENVFQKGLKRILKRIIKK